MPAAPGSTGVTITNPLVLYRALLATKRIDPDPAQHRLALHLQKLYERLKDYEPIVQYGHRLQQISRALGSTPGRPLDVGLRDGHTQKTDQPGVLSSLFKQKEEKDAMALTRVLTNHERALQLDSPQGLMLHGEVGTGKSMLIDLFADCLPNRKKRRWHFNTFMLETLSKLEQLRRSRHLIIPTSLGVQDDYSLLWLARDLISTSPIIFLDEFQLPDRAATKIMTNLMTSFFQLGGVLIATSNRMPEELAKAAGMEFTPPPSRMDSLGWKMFGKAQDKSSKMYPGNLEFAAFLEVLRARCEIWEMESSHDYRRRDTTNESGNTVDHEIDLEAFQGLQPMSTGNVGLGYEQSARTEDAEVDSLPKTSSLPVNYLLSPDDGSSEHREAIDAAITNVEAQVLSDSSNLWSPGYMTVYGRSVTVPRQHSGVTKWTFAELCEHPHGPADYITLASTYHTLILTDVPILTVLRRNEARRFITLLDALYEARCKLFITAQAGPDDIFFPETKLLPKDPAGQGEETVSHDPVYSETISEIYQDQTAPFRPNISMYAGDTSEPDYTHARLAGVLSSNYQPPDALEDGPPNTLKRGDSIYGRDIGPVDPDATRPGPDFSQAGIFTGEDEKFAFKRARSRLWELCGQRWWARPNESTDPLAPSWWQPLDASVRVWEAGSLSSSSTLPQPPMNNDDSAHPAEGTSGSRAISEQQDEVLFRHGASPFRTHAEPPPKLAWTHVWGMMKWGKKAGAWGQGPEGLAQREKEKIEEREREQELERENNSTAKKT